MNYIADLSSSLSSDYGKLYKSGKYTDISIHVGREPNNKIVFAHAVVLCARSAYLENSLTRNTEASNTRIPTQLYPTPGYIPKFCKNKWPAKKDCMQLFSCYLFDIYIECCE